MTLLETVRLAYAEGIDLTSDSRTLKLAGDQSPSPALRAALIANKPALVALLDAEGIGKGDDYPSGVPKRCPTPPGCHARGACARLGWCPRALAGTGCGVGATQEGGADAPRD